MERTAKMAHALSISTAIPTRLHDMTACDQRAVVTELPPKENEANTSPRTSTSYTRLTYCCGGLVFIHHTPHLIHVAPALAEAQQTHTHILSSLTYCNGVYTTHHTTPDSRGTPGLRFREATNRPYNCCLTTVAILKYNIMTPP